MKVNIDPTTNVNIRAAWSCTPTGGLDGGTDLIDEGCFSDCVPGPVRCNAKDNDCDGLVDEGCSIFG